MEDADTRLVIEHLQDYNLHFVRKDREKVLVRPVVLDDLHLLYVVSSICPFPSSLSFFV